MKGIMNSITQFYTPSATTANISTVSVNPSEKKPVVNLPNTIKNSKKRKFVRSTLFWNEVENMFEEMDEWEQVEETQEGET